MEESVNIRTQLPKTLYWNFKQKCKFYELNVQDVLAGLVEKFLDGEFDKDFNIKP